MLRPYEATIAGYSDLMHPTAQLDVPVAEVTDFEGLEIGWDRRVLRPRPWTAEQGRWAAEILLDSSPGRILELCCGAGHIGLLAAQGSGRDLVQVDEDPVAACWAQRNAEVASVASDVRTGPLDASLGSGERFPMVIADPPWLSTTPVAAPGEPGVGADEDFQGALDQCVLLILEHLVPEGHAVLQVGLSQQIGRIGRWLDAHAAENPSAPARAVLAVRDRRPGGYLIHIGPAAEADWT